MSASCPAGCPLTIAEALARAAALAPDVEAVVASDGRITYAELAEDVARLRAQMVAAGITKGEHVGLCLGNSVRWVSLFLALGSIGAVTVPLNTRWRSAEIAYALGQSRVRVLFTADRFLSSDFVAMLREAAPEVDHALPGATLPDLRAVIVVGEDVPKGAVSFETFRTAPSKAVQPDCTPDDPLLIQYTSGTTAAPKGVVLTHTNMLGNAFVSGGRIGFRIADRFHSARPFFHVAGSTLSVLSALQHMVTLVTMDRFEGEAALELMERERCTHFSGNDTMALMLLDSPSRSRRRLHLRGGWVAGSPTVLHRVATELGAAEVVAGYGQSEASPNIAQSCWWEPADIRLGARMRLQPGVEVRIERDPGAADDAPGEIVTRGWNVMRGYYGKPAETAAALDSEGWLRTGDLGVLDPDGRLRFIGRAKDIIRVGGENVAPAEVEDLLARHPAVRQAAVVGVPDQRLVEVVAAFAVLREGAECSPDALADWCRERVAGFKVPRHVWIVDGFEDIGMTASSKVQKKPLAAHARRLMGLDA